MYVDATEVIFSAAKFRVILRGGAFSSWFFTKTKFDKQLNTIFIEGKTSGTFVQLYQPSIYQLGSRMPKSPLL